MLGHDSVKELNCGSAALRVAIHEYLASLIPSRKTASKFVIDWRCAKCGMSGSVRGSTKRQAIYEMRQDHRIRRKTLHRLESIRATHKFDTAGKESDGKIPEKRFLSAFGRRRIIEAQRKRWAHYRAEHPTLDI